MNKKRKDAEQQEINPAEREKRFLLIFGGCAGYHSAPLECKSVEKVKSELKWARDAYSLKMCPTAGLAFLALVLDARINRYDSVHSKGSARSHFSGEHFGDSPAIGDDEKDMDYVVDGKELISDEELSLWRNEEERLTTVDKETSPLYEVYIVDDNA
jgi:hypothetical protein